MALVSQEIRVAIESDADIVTARERGRALAVQFGFSPTDAVLIATSISELARNIVLYAKRGEIRLEQITGNKGTGIQVIAADKGPGILDINLALQVGYSTSGGFGLGLPGVRRLMDEFQIESQVGHGTTVTAKKWSHPTSR